MMTENTQTELLGACVDHACVVGGWTRRWDCGDWQLWEGWLYIAANMVIFLAYMAIPLSIYMATKALKVEVMGSSWLSRIFMAFILLCGVGHAIDGVLAMYWAHYDWIVWWHTATAIVSVMTVISIPIAIGGVAKSINEALADSRKLASNGND